MSKTYLLLGGNIGDTKAIFEETLQSIADLCGKIIQKSGVYMSEAWGFETENIFLNQVLLLETELKPEHLLNTLLTIEQEMGRVRTNETGYTSRVIDIDILFYDSLIIKKDKLTIPHPLLHKRRFTLQPLVEIAANYVHPIMLKSSKELLDECEDNLSVKRAD